MSTPVSPTLADERDSYPIHEEDDVPEIDAHERQVRYARDALQTYFPDRYVGGNLCIYWERGNRRRYIAPDLFVARGFPVDPKPRVYLLWEDPPVSFVLEVISRQTASQVEKNRGIYRRHMQVPEVLEVNAEQHQVVLWRLGPAGYEAVVPEGAPGNAGTGRLRSQELGLEFELDENDFLWIYTLAGERLLTYEEENQRRVEAEARVAVEARQREAAEARAAEEAAQRRELERQLAELQARLQERGD